MSGSTSDVPVVLTSAGRVNTPPSTLNAEVIANASAMAPGLTVLPGGLIEDLSSTATGTLVLIDQAVTETIDSLTPWGANNYLLTELGQIYLGQGSTATSASNTSVGLVFSGTPGFVVPPGFVVGDGTNQYVVVNGVVINTGGTSNLAIARATQPGSWAVPANSVTSIVTSVPSTVTLAVTNPSAGTPGEPAQTPGEYRAQVLQAGLVASTGTPNYLKTLLQQVPGVVGSLVSVRQVTTSAGTPAWEIIVGGSADPNAVALAIFQAVPDISTLVGSTLYVTGITQAASGVVTLDKDHGYSVGQRVTLKGVAGPVSLNGTSLQITDVPSPTSFAIGVDTSGLPAYVSGGVCTPNFRNVVATISSYPDTYVIPFVVPPAQDVAVVVTWATNSATFVSNEAITALVQPALADYINAVPVGAPISVLALNDTFTMAVASILPENLLSVLTFSVSINGVVTPPGAGTQVISGDPESYFTMPASAVTVIQG